MPPAAKTSASPIVATVRPTGARGDLAPADLEALVGLGVRPQRDPAGAHEGGHARRSRAIDAVDVDDDRRRVELDRGRIVAGRSCGSSATSSFVGRYAPGAPAA